MERTCDCCPNPAIVHETLVQNGVKNEVHLCAEHAAERGYILPTASGASPRSMPVEPDGSPP